MLWVLARSRKIAYAAHMKIYKDFQFEAAHYLPSAEPGHPNSRVHGHSFRARIVVQGSPDPETGLIVHFDDLTAAISEVRDALDHHMLNEISGLEAPTLERIAIWIWDHVLTDVPGLVEVQVMRESCGEGCIYHGPPGEITYE